LIAGRKRDNIPAMLAPSKVAEFRARAAEASRLAQSAPSPEARAALLHDASLFERMAQFEEQATISGDDEA